jgi:hypothetical protein
LFPQYIILFPQHILFLQYIIINTNYFSLSTEATHLIRPDFKCIQITKY